MCVCLRVFRIGAPPEQKMWALKKGTWRRIHVHVYRITRDIPKRITGHRAGAFLNLSRFSNLPSKNVVPMFTLSKNT